MDSPVSNTTWARTSNVSSVTVGLFSWLEDVSGLWRARQLGAFRWVPASAVFLLYITAALFAGLSYACDTVALSVKDRVRAGLEDRRAARQLRRVVAAGLLRQASTPEI